jgi:hypothetical protein
MKVFFDERCLPSSDLSGLLRLWRQIADLAAKDASGLSLYLDGHAVREGTFLHRLNALRADDRILFVPMLFGTAYVRDWRAVEIAPDVICQLSTETSPVTNCAICEAYEHRKVIETVALFGHERSSYVHFDSVGIIKLDPLEARVEVTCGTSLADFRRIGTTWNCLRDHYDVTLSRPPRDHETVLGHSPERFSRVGRFERHGRRHVYRETDTNRLFYVDNLHSGLAAHLEVFGPDGDHLGTADLNGNLNESTRVPGRNILW